MNERYWEVGDLPDSFARPSFTVTLSSDFEEEIADLVSENVTRAVQYFWEEDQIIGEIDIKDGRVQVVILGPPKPSEKDPSGELDIYHSSVDLLEKLTDYATPYGDVGGPCSDEQIEDMRGRIAALRVLAAEIIGIADAGDKLACQEIGK